MKNLANCKPSEFLRQTVRIRRAVENWLNVTDIINIRKRIPELRKPYPGMSDEEKQALFDENRRIAAEQVKKNGMEIIDQIMEKHPDETLEILALCCFVEPEEVDNHTVSEYLLNLSELMQDTAVISFFTSLMQLGQMNILTVSKA